MYYAHGKHAEPNTFNVIALKSVFDRSYGM